MIGTPCLPSLTPQEFSPPKPLQRLETRPSGEGEQQIRIAASLWCCQIAVHARDGRTLHYGTEGAQHHLLYHNRLCVNACPNHYDVLWPLAPPRSQRPPKATPPTTVRKDPAGPTHGTKCNGRAPASSLCWSPASPIGPTAHIQLQRRQTYLWARSHYHGQHRWLKRCSHVGV